MSVFGLVLNIRDIFKWGIVLYRLYRLIRDLKKAYDKQEQLEKRKRLNAALDKLEKSKTKEEIRAAMDDISRDSF